MRCATHVVRDSGLREMQSAAPRSVRSVSFKRPACHLRGLLVAAAVWIAAEAIAVALEPSSRVVPLAHRPVGPLPPQPNVQASQRYCRAQLQGSLGNEDFPPDPQRPSSPPSFAATGSLHVCWRLRMAWIARRAAAPHAFGGHQLCLWRHPKPDVVWRRLCACCETCPAICLQ